MSAGFYCMWSDYRRVPCGKGATHGTLLGEGIYYLCHVPRGTGAP